jgi:hypothetical protein
MNQLMPPTGQPMQQGAMKLPGVGTVFPEDIQKFQAENARGARPPSVNEAAQAYDFSVQQSPDPLVQRQIFEEILRQQNINPYIVPEGLVPTGG